MAKGLEEVFGMFPASVLHAAVVNNEGKEDGASFVAPETGGGFALVVAVGKEAFGQEIAASLPACLSPYMPMVIL